VPKILRAAMCVVLLALVGCARTPPQADLPNQVPARGGAVGQRPVPVQVVPGVTPASLGIQATPTPPVGVQPGAPGGRPATVVPGDPVTVALEQVPLPVFLDAVLGDSLGLAYTVDPRVRARTDLVTLRMTRPRPPSEVLGVVSQVLRDYGIELAIEADRVRVVPSDVLASEMPRIVRSRSLPEVPASMRPLFQVVDLGAVAVGEAVQLVQSAFGQRIRALPAGAANAVVLMGLPEDVRAAVDAVRVIDQPRLAGRRSIRVEPVFWTAQRLADKLAEVLRAEGYDVSSSGGQPAAVTLVAVPNINAVLGFAADGPVLDHVARWARTLDQPARADPQRTVFFYSVRNTTAQSLFQVLRGVVDATGGEPAEERPTGAALPAETTSLAAIAGLPPLVLPPGQAPPPFLSETARGPVGVTVEPPPPARREETQVAGRRARLIVDHARNGLIFIGGAEEFAQIRPLMESLDQPPREALIEVTIAEVTLDDSTALGIEWALNLGLGDLRGVVSTLGGLGRGTGGLNFTILNSAGDVRSILNAFARDDRVSILSTPRVLTRSGGRARIQVGTEVPIVTGQATGSGFQVGGTTGFLQQVQYRNTGVILTVRPTIYAGNQIDLELTQEVSEPQQNQLTAVPSPVIVNRQLNTQLSLRDGATVLLGGLMTENRNAGRGGIPGLSDIPLIGNLFATQTSRARKSELLLFITPYVIQSGDDAQAITDAFRERLRQMPQPPQGIRLTPSLSDVR
jgi:general secretion pathway protein D